MCRSPARFKARTKWTSSHLPWGDRCGGEESWQPWEATLPHLNQILLPKQKKKKKKAMLFQEIQPPRNILIAFLTHGIPLWSPSLWHWKGWYRRKGTNGATRVSFSYQFFLLVKMPQVESFGRMPTYQEVKWKVELIWGSVSTLLVRMKNTGTHRSWYLGCGGFGHSAHESNALVSAFRTDKVQHEAE